MGSIRDGRFFTALKQKSVSVGFFATSVKWPSFEAKNLVSQKGLLVAPDNAFTPCVNGGLGAVAEVQFAEDIADVTLNRLWTDKERLSNIIV